MDSESSILKIYLLVAWRHLPNITLAAIFFPKLTTVLDFLI